MLLKHEGCRSYKNLHHGLWITIIVLDIITAEDGKLTVEWIKGKRCNHLQFNSSQLRLLNSWCSQEYALFSESSKILTRIHHPFPKKSFFGRVPPSRKCAACICSTADFEKNYNLSRNVCWVTRKYVLGLCANKACRLIWGRVMRDIRYPNWYTDPVFRLIW